MTENTNVGGIFAAELAASHEPGLKKLEGTSEMKAAGEFVLRSMELATKEGFGHVAKEWYRKTMDYASGLEQIEQGRAVTEDIVATVADMRPRCIDGKFVMQFKDGRNFAPTTYAMSQIGNWADTGTWYVQSLLDAKTDNKQREVYKRDGEDAETLYRVIWNGFRRLDQSKPFLWRTRKDGTLRAMLTTKFAKIDNRWFIERLAEFVPGGRLSHWRGDSDTIFGNVLIPDTIRADSDSDYGGMLSIGNSEIGERRVSSLPSIFRAICRNGCIWGDKAGQGIRQVHRGKIDLKALALEIKENLNRQIPLLPQGIDRLLGTRAYGWDGCSVEPIIAVVAKDYGLSKRNASDILRAYKVEKAQTPDSAASLFGLTNAVTRAGQKLEPSEWVKFDGVGGELIGLDKDEFNSLINHAKRLKPKEVADSFLMV
jgi:hypothetical protein